ncbi:RNA polymerase sigma-70 factor (ECF subfamily) [Chitinophaga skermanii]|uniref:RNA polymerase sigma-70 factor (ECF subfamily) n=1 Tax=Chitinophaga skermanii TaxID=331697 RepID=A0A327QDA3_9BACT|nr:RNA polymerase sigma factor [Chitinophaga skermanii]RAJ02281.1 RNA polymerase sigma-70 factor (ECF subfamily) [Chitinophaga skermanii]
MNSIVVLKSGDEQAFARIFEQFQPVLLQYFSQRTACKQTAEELVQLTFIKLWRVSGKLSGEHSLRVQIFRIARTTFIDYWRKENQAKKIFDAGTSIHEEFPYLEEGGTTGFENKQMLRVALNKLPKVRKMVVTMRIQGFSNKEIAQQFTISIKTVEDHITKAHHQLRSLLQQPQPTEAV